MADQREEILNFIKYNGPILPVNIAKHINTNILFASAILSELVSRKMLKITHAAIGGSPLYYLSGQEDRVDSRLSTSLSGREKEAYHLLKEKKVLKESDLEPWQRVALKNLDDFASSITAKHNENTETFWKHTLVSDEEAKTIISDIMDGTKNDIEIPIENIDNVPVERIEEKEIPVPQFQKQENLTQEPIPDEPADEINKNLIKTTEPKQKIEKKERKVDLKFYSRVLEFINNNNVEILKEEVIKKNKEIDFVVNITTNFGKLRYLIKAKNKATINESDVSMAFSEGQLKKIPVIMLVNGKINKKAVLLAEQKMQGQLTLKEV